MATGDHNHRLAEALKRVGYPPSVVKAARRGNWSDFESSLPLPKMDLVEMLTTDGHEELAERVVKGEFDG